MSSQSAPNPAARYDASIAETLAKGRRAAPIAVAVLLAAYLLWRVRSVLPPFLIALFFAALLDPVVTRIERRGIARGKAVGALFVVALLMVGTVGTMIVPSVVAQVTDLASNVSTYAENVTRVAEGLTQRADRWYLRHETTLKSLGMTETPSKYLQQQAGPVSGAVRGFLDGLRATIAGLLGQVLWLIIVPLSLFYFLLDYPKIRRRVIGLLPVSSRDDAEQMVAAVLEIFSAYVRGLTKVCVLYGATAAVLFWILKLKYALFMGTAAGVFYAVPYVGPALTVVSIAVLAITTGKTVGFTLLAVILFVGMHLTYDYGITPRIVGGSVGLHPLVNIFALMCGVTLFGVWGMILAVPVAASIQRILLQCFPALASSSDSPTSSS